MSEVLKDTHNKGRSFFISLSLSLFFFPCTTDMTSLPVGGKKSLCQKGLKIENGKLCVFGLCI